ncbi:hypothetical protein, partial [Stenotrophomonas sp.]|uniref:hypothetical protein n=1 Tax=Stenotrophomonas sp. TaxID=69392 RepID=UPI0028A86DFE
MTETSNIACSARSITLNPRHSHNSVFSFARQPMPCLTTSRIGSTNGSIDMHAHNLLVASLSLAVVAVT